MPNVTSRIGLKIPIGTENFNRAAYNENLNILEKKVPILILSTEQPSQDANTLWYQDLGDTPDLSTSLLMGNASLNNDNQIWFDEI